MLWLIWMLVHVENGRWSIRSRRRRLASIAKDLPCGVLVMGVINGSLRAYVRPTQLPEPSMAFLREALTFNSLTRSTSFAWSAGPTSHMLLGDLDLHLRSEGPAGPGGRHWRVSEGRHALPLCMIHLTTLWLRPPG